jgi:hypothetical protein
MSANEEVPSVDTLTGAAVTPSDVAGAAGASLWSNTEEDDCCRVCHGEAEESRQLFHPCRCSGSIKYVHQDCLQTWLKFSKQSHPKCELCGEYFTFRNIYSSGVEGKPPRLSVFEFLQGLYTITLRSLIIMGKASLTILLWIVLLPLFSYWSLEVTKALNSFTVTGVSTDLWHLFRIADIYRSLFPSLIDFLGCW